MDFSYPALIEDLWSEYWDRTTRCPLLAQLASTLHVFSYPLSTHVCLWYTCYVVMYCLCWVCIDCISMHGITLTSESASCSLSLLFSCHLGTDCVWVSRIVPMISREYIILCLNEPAEWSLLVMLWPITLCMLSVGHIICVKCTLIHLRSHPILHFCLLSHTVMQPAIHRTAVTIFHRQHTIITQEITSQLWNPPLQGAPGREDH